MKKALEKLFAEAATYTTEPIDQLSVELALNDVKLSIRQALEFDITNLILRDFAYRYNIGNSDVAVNIQGQAGKGKSNMLLWLGMKWCAITGKPYDLSLVTQNAITYNLLLKGYKVIDHADGSISVNEFEHEPGTHFSLDEATDHNRSGTMAQTAIWQTADLEGRLRINKTARFCAGTRELLKQSYYNIFAFERNPKEKLCIGLVFVRDEQGKKRWLGSVRIPYVPQYVFDAYNKPKKDSIRAYARGANVSQVAKLMDYFAGELRENDEYQALPTQPPSIRVNWLQRSAKYSAFTANRYFEDLEKLARRSKDLLQ